MKTVQLVAALLLGCVLGVQAETTNPKVDSLKRLLQSRQPIDKAEVLWSIAYELFDVDNPQAVFYAERAYHEVWAKGDSLQIVKVGTTYGQLLRRVGKVNLSIEISTELLHVAARNNFKKYRRMLLNSLGNSFSYKEDFGKGLEFIYETMHITETEGDSIGMALALLNIGFVLFKTHDYRTSIKYSRDAYRLSERLSLKENLVNSCFNIGSAYAGMEIQDSAKYFYRKTLALAREPNLSANLPQFYQSYAYTLCELKSLDSAEYYARLAVREGSQGSHLWAVSMSYILLSRLALMKGNTPLSWQMILKADSVNVTNDYPRAKTMLMKQKSKYFNAIGDMVSSSIYLDRYYKVTDSIHHWRDNEKTRILQLTFEQRANKQKIKAQAELVKLKNSIIDKNNKFILVVSFLLVFLGILAISLYQSKRREHLINVMLDERVAERTKELLDQRDELVHNREEQRISKQKIYQDIRSEVNSLTGIVHLAGIDRPSKMEEYLRVASQALTRLDETAKKLISESK